MQENRMDYYKIYQNLIEDAKTNPKIDEYKESHHIIPRCIGGTDSKENLVKLTARQHFLAHWLLYKMYKTSELVYAWHSMSRVGVGQDARLVNSHLFEYAKKKRSKHLSADKLGEGNHFYGKRHSDRTKKLLSDIHRGKIYKTQEQIESWVESVAKRKKTPEQRAKISRRGYVMLQNKTTLEIIRVLKSDERAHSSEWANPRKLKPEQKSKCVYCNVVTTNSNLKRWHNDNCKRKI